MDEYEYVRSEDCLNKTCPAGFQCLCDQDFEDGPVLCRACWDLNPKEG